MNSNQLLNEFLILRRQIYSVNILSFIIISLGYFLEVILSNEIKDNQISYIENIYEINNIGLGMLFSSLLISGYCSKKIRKFKKDINK